MKNVRRFGGAVVLALMLLGVATFAFASSGAPQTAPDINADIASGKAHQLPEGPNNWEYVSVWHNCRFVYIKTHIIYYVEGGHAIGVSPSTEAASAAKKLAEADGADVKPNSAAVKPTTCAPTAAQIADDHAHMASLSQSTRPAGWSPMPPTPPPGG